MLFQALSCTLSFFFFFIFEIGSHCAALTVLELNMETMLASSSLRSLAVFASPVFASPVVGLKVCASKHVKTFFRKLYLH